MGQHKYNPTAIAAKNGELPPKPKKMGKRARERLLMRVVYEATGLDAVDRAVGIDSYKEAVEMAELLRGR